MVCVTTSIWETTVTMTTCAKSIAVARPSLCLFDVLLHHVFLNRSKRRYRLLAIFADEMQRNSDAAFRRRAGKFAKGRKP